MIVKNKFRFATKPFLEDVFALNSIDLFMEKGRYSSDIILSHPHVSNGWIRLAGKNGSITFYPDYEIVIEFQCGNGKVFKSAPLKMYATYRNYDMWLYDDHLSQFWIWPFSHVGPITNERNMWEEQMNDLLKIYEIDVNSKLYFSAVDEGEYTHLTIPITKSDNFEGCCRLLIRENFFK